MKVGSSVILVILLALLLTSSALAAEGIAKERIDLFIASRQMLMEERTPPRMKVGMALTSLGNHSEISMGVRIESRLGANEKLRVISETIYLKEEQTLGGFLSLKFIPFDENFHAVYLGAGAGYVDGFRYQDFAGIDLTKHFFAEARYVNYPGGLGNKGLYLATGFQFTY